MPTFALEVAANPLPGFTAGTVLPRYPLNREVDQALLAPAVDSASNVAVTKFTLAPRAEPAATEEDPPLRYALTPTLPAGLSGTAPARVTAFGPPAGGTLATDAVDVIGERFGRQPTARQVTVGEQAVTLDRDARSSSGVARCRAGRTAWERWASLDAGQRPAFPRGLVDYGAGLGQRSFDRTHAVTP